MNFAHNELGLEYQHNNTKVGSNINEINNIERQNCFNAKILDSIVDDNKEKFIELISQIANNDSDPNKTLIMTKHKLPKILSSHPSYASLCAFFCSEKCFTALTMLYPEGLSSKSFKKKDDYERTLFHFACAGGSLSIIRELFQAGFDINATDSDGYVPSHYSAMTGTIDVFKYLWSKGSNVLRKGFFCTSPLDIACLYGNLEIVKFIIEKVNPEEISSLAKYQFKYGFNTPLHFACEGGHSEVVDYFLSLKNYPKKLLNIVDLKGQTPLSVACQNGSLKCVKSLILKGKASITSSSKKNLPLIDASSGGYVDIVKFLIQKTDVDIDASNSFKITALEAAILNGHLDVIEILTQNGAGQNLNQTEVGRLFLTACDNPNDDIVKSLDKSFIVPYDKFGAAFMKRACVSKNEKLVTFLLNHNCTLKGVDIADLNFRSKFTPFMQFLKEKGCDFSEINDSLVVKTVKNGGLRSLKELISNGIEINKKIICENNLLSYACCNVKLDFVTFFMAFKPELDDSDSIFIDVMMKLEASRNLSSAKKVTDCLKIAEILLKDSNVNPNNESIISTALSYCSIEVLDLLHKYGAKFDNLALDLKKIMIRDYMALIDFLKEKSVNLNSLVSVSGDPIIVESIKYRKMDFIEKLISEGVELNDRIILQYDLIEFACSIGDLNIFNFLLNFKPSITDGTVCLKKLFSSENLSCIKKLDDRLQIADILLVNFKANPNDESVIEFAASESLIKILELLGNHGADFTNCCLDFSKMIMSSHIQIFNFLKDHGCTFQNVKKIVGRQYNFDENDSAIMVNFKCLRRYNYDIRTLLFLLDYSSNGDILSLKTRKNVTNVHFDHQKADKNIIDVLISFNCFDGILKVYNKVNQIVLPKATTVDEYKNLIQSCNNQELKNMVASISNLSN